MKDNTTQEAKDVYMDAAAMMKMLEDPSALSVSSMYEEARGHMDMSPRYRRQEGRYEEPRMSIIGHFMDSAADGKALMDNPVFTRMFKNMMKAFSGDSFRIVRSLDMNGDPMRGLNGRPMYELTDGPYLMAGGYLGEYFDDPDPVIDGKKKDVDVLDSEQPSSYYFLMSSICSGMGVRVGFNDETEFPKMIQDDYDPKLNPESSAYRQGQTPDPAFCDSKALSAILTEGSRPDAEYLGPERKTVQEDGYTVSTLTNSECFELEAKDGCGPDIHIDGTLKAVEMLASFFRFCAIYDLRKASQDKGRSAFPFIVEYNSSLRDVEKYLGDVLLIRDETSILYETGGLPPETLDKMDAEDDRILAEAGLDESLLGADHVLPGKILDKPVRFRGVIQLASSPDMIRKFLRAMGMDGLDGHNASELFHSPKEVLDRYRMVRTDTDKILRRRFINMWMNGNILGAKEYSRYDDDCEEVAASRSSLSTPYDALMPYMAPRLTLGEYGRSLSGRYLGQLTPNGFEIPMECLYRYDDISHDITKRISKNVISYGSLAGKKEKDVVLNPVAYVATSVSSREKDGKTEYVPRYSPCYTIDKLEEYRAMVDTHIPASMKKWKDSDGYPIKFVAFELDRQIESSIDRRCRPFVRHANEMTLKALRNDKERYYSSKSQSPDRAARDR